jgi:hypothetical protein
MAHQAAGRVLDKAGADLFNLDCLILFEPVVFRTLAVI